MKFKVLVWKPLAYSSSEVLFASPVADREEGFSWGLSTRPELMLPTATIEALQTLYPTLDYTKVDLIDVELKFNDGTKGTPGE